MKLKKMLFMFLIASTVLCCVPVISHTHGYSHADDGLTAEAIDEMIARLERLKKRIPKGGILKFTQEEMLAWHMEEVKHCEAYKQMPPDARRKFDEQIEMARKEFQLHKAREEQKRKQMQNSASHGNDTPEMRIIPKKNKTNKNRPRRKRARKVIPGNV